MKSIKEYIECKNIIENIELPIEDYIVEHKGDFCFYDKRFDPFGGLWQLHTEYLYETLLYSYSLEKFVNKLKSIFDVLYYEIDNENMLFARFGNNFNKDNKELISLCNLFNVFINKIEKRGDVLVDVSFEQRKPKNITEKIYKENDILYHITSSNVVNKILKYGLQPKTHSKKTYHPERIYLFSEHIPKQFLENMKKQLGGDIVLKIDIKKLYNDYDKKLTLYEDPMTPGEYGMFTENTIYPVIISKI